jgi:hypothetical protein
MLGFPGEDYTSPETIKATGGFGNPPIAPSGSGGCRGRWSAPSRWACRT